MYSHCPKCGSDKDVRVKVVDGGTELQFQFGCHSCNIFGKSGKNYIYAMVFWDSMIFETFVDR